MKYNRKNALAMISLALATAISLSACVINQAPAGQVPTSSQAAASAQADGATSKLNINTASEAELLQIPGVGENMVKEFLEYRPFTNQEHFRKEIGKYVDAAQLTEYEKYLFVPVHINTATEAELLTIPGVGENMVKEFLEYRPFTNQEHFRKEIGKYVDATQLTEYEKYIVID